MSKYTRLHTLFLILRNAVASNDQTLIASLADDIKSILAEPE